MHVLTNRTVQLGYICLGVEWEGCIWYSFGKYIKEKLLLEVIVCLLQIYNLSGRTLSCGTELACFLLFESRSSRHFYYPSQCVHIISVFCESWCLELGKNGISIHVFLLMDLEREETNFFMLKYWLQPYDLLHTDVMNGGGSMVSFIQKRFH